LDRTYRPSTAETASSPSESGVLFSVFRLERDGSFFRGSSPIHLPPRELGALRLLLANVGQIVTPLQFRQALWGDVHVTAESVPKCLSSLRARLQPDDCIQTVYKRGYRLIAEVHPLIVSNAKTLPRLAIPPFSTDLGVPEHMGAVTAEETIARLTNSASPLAALLARDSVFTLAANGLTAIQIGQALNADLVLAGTLRGQQSHIRLRAEMVRVSDGVQIWVEDLLVERGSSSELEVALAARLEARLQTWPLESIRSTRNTAARNFASDQEISGRPPREMIDPAQGGTLQSLAASAEDVAEKQAPSTTSEAYEAYLHGHHEWQTLERHRMQDGLQQLTRAIELDPSLIAARVDLGHLCVTQTMYGFMSPAVSADLVHRTAESIPDLPRQAAKIMPALAWVNFHFDRNLPAALWAFELSSHLPHDPWVTRMRAMFALSRNRFEEAIEILRAALEMDPFSPWLNSRLAWALHLSGQAAESLKQVEHCLRLFPDHEGTALYGSSLLAFHGATERAVELAEGLARRLPYFDLATSVLANALACAGRAEEALAMLERLQWLSRERYVLGSFSAAAYIALGVPEAALAELHTSNDLRCPWFFQVLADPRLKPLHGFRGFQELQAILPRMEAAARASSGDADQASE